MSSNLCYDSVRIRSSWSWTPEKPGLPERRSSTRPAGRPAEEARGRGFSRRQSQSKVWGVMSGNLGSKHGAEAGIQMETVLICGFRGGITFDYGEVIF